jgi:hypothetical protein
MPQLRGRVVGNDDRPVADARLFFLANPDSVQEISALTGPDGAFTLNLPKPGAYRLGARAEGHGPGEVEVTVSSEPLQPVIIKLEKGESS